MKKISFKVAALLLAGSMLSTSCIGSFKLFNKYEKWQCSMTNSKIVNGIVGLILQPVVGGVCLFVDALVLNTIEFWSGNNPIAMNSIQEVRGQDGLMYAVKTTKKGYEITSPTGEVTKLIFNQKENSWSVSQNGVTKEIIRFNADGTIQTTLPNGKLLTVTNDEAGLEQVYFMTTTDSYAMR